METILFALALFGIVAGVYTLFLPSLRKRGWSLPFMNLIANDDEEEDDDDLDEPFERFNEPKARRGGGGPGGKSPVPSRFIGKPGTELSPLSSKPRAKRPTRDGEEEEEEIDIHALAIIETPNAGQDPEDLELDPELAALIDMSDDDAASAEGGDAAAADAQ